MKKKLTAVLLTLCMVLGMLPMTALAVWQTSDGKDVTITNNTFDVDGNKYYVKEGSVPSEPSKDSTVDYWDNYTFDGSKAGTLTWVVEATAKVEATVTGGTATVTESAVKSAVEEALKESTDAGVLNIEVTSGDDGEDFTAFDVPVDSTTIDEIIAAGVDLSIGTDEVASVKLPKDLVKEFAGKKVELKLNAAATKPASAPALTNATTAKYVEITLEVGGTEQSSLGKSVTVSVKPESMPENPRVYYVNSSAYSLVSSSVVGDLIQWTTDHFSTWTYMSLADATSNGLKVNTPAGTTVESITPETDPQGKAFTVSGTAGQTVLYDAKAGSGSSTVHTILSTTIGEGGSAKVVVSDNVVSMNIWVADSITWDDGYTATGNVAAYEWTK